MSGMHPHIVPYRFNGIELRTLRRQQTKVEAMPVIREPLLDFGSLVVRRIVMNKEDFLLAVTLCDGTEKHRITLAFEYLAVPIVEFGPVEIHRPKDFLGIALAGRRNQRLVPASR